MAEETALRIVRLEAANVKRLTAVEITPDGNLVVIGGQNGAGKSSVLDSIAYALGGRDALCDEPLRQGTAKGHIVVDLGDLVVRRTFSAKTGSAVTVEGKDGARFQSPQALLDRLVGRLSFDPLAFARMDVKAQRETLRQLVGLDFRELDLRRAKLFDERTGINRDTKALEARIAGMPAHPTSPDELVSVKALLEELAAAEATQRKVAAADQTQQQSLNQAQVSIDAAKAIDIEIAKLQKQRQVAAEAARLETARAESLLGDVAAARMNAVDPAPVREKIAASEGINARVSANRARGIQVNELRGKRHEGERLTEQIDAIDAQKAAALEGAKFPVDGLAFDDDGVRLDGVPFSQASSAEQLRVSVAMAAAINPRLRIALVRDGSLLDAHSMKVLAEYAAANDMQLWIEKVSDDGVGCSVVIEEGAVRAAEVAP